MRIMHVEVYDFKELSEPAKDRAKRDYLEKNPDENRNLSNDTFATICAVNQWEFLIDGHRCIGEVNL